ncbi:SDR family oxidoreductase [Nonlabens marinus]|uniref:Oxidoreductase, short chain dehydrogenase/reductase family n=1 Tax=Nonlabens marinus S1-08 TaxID=1454201 RepID=W8VXQ2_9FLAO|nr:SDR family oxidoreductase [Nonlabens marinus]BAO56322.1 oxidoreductase, short chain dehydrogenase/reductase family [Nonlabens marinus S1-08]
MVKDLEGTYGLILGGSSGLGYASAVKCANHGMKLIVIYRSGRAQQDVVNQRFEILKNSSNHLFINADATNELKIPGLIEELKNYLNGQRLFLLLHSISKGNLKPMKGESALNTGDFTQTIQSMGISLYAWAQALRSAGLLANPSRVISFTSEGNQKPMPGYAAVSAAKATLEAITRNMALEFAVEGITTNCIQAGVTDTESLQRIPMYEELKKNSLQRNPFNRLTQPEDVANTVYLLCRPEAAFINGSVIKVDGGESLT